MTQDREDSDLIDEAANETDSLFSHRSISRSLLRKSSRKFRTRSRSQQSFRESPLKAVQYALLATDYTDDLSDDDADLFVRRRRFALTHDSTLTQSLCLEYDSAHASFEYHLLEKLGTALREKSDQVQKVMIISLIHKKNTLIS